MLKENEYLSIKLNTKEALYLAHKAISEGKEEIFLSAGTNKDKTNENHPLFKGQRGALAIWINKQKENQVELNKPTEEKIE